MSVSGILSSVVSSILSPQIHAAQSNGHQFQQEFQRLGEDLQTGNLSAAQSDFATLQQNTPSGSPLSNAGSSTQDSNSLTNAFSQLSQDLQAGNLSGAQSDFAAIQQDFQSRGAHGRHHRDAGAESSTVRQEFQQLGQALQSGNLANAQQAYTSLQQDFQQFLAGSGVATQDGLPAQSASPNISVNA
jgi:hypothetical protein